MTKKRDKLESRLVSSMFKHAEKMLTHWPTWRNLLLGDSLNGQHLEIACRLLYAIVCHSSGITDADLRRPPLPETLVDKVIL